MDELLVYLENQQKNGMTELSWNEIDGFFEITRRLMSCVKEIREKTDFVPRLGVVLGSGLGGFADEIEVVKRIPYTEISDFPKSTVEGHKGEYIFGYIDDIPLVLMAGRTHYYEGYSMEQAVMPVRIMALLGAEKILLTNAAGGINKDFVPGTLMCINDHISSFVPSPLIGPNDILGPRFPDMSEVYDKEFGKIMHETADELGINLRDGVYVQTTGPNYETPAEIRMYGMLGADAVGMSTACEAIALRHMGVRLAGISCITNMASGISQTKLSHEEVKETADRVSAMFKSLVKEFIKKLAEII